ncbi:PadR family transcriptional regulator [Flindersiella endophytica]
MAFRALRTPLTMAILSLLRERPRHPYEMQATLREREVGMVVKLRGGSLYDAIRRMEAAELIEPVQTGRSGARPEHTVYQPTSAGLELLGSLLREYVGTVVPEFPVFPAGLAHILHFTPAEAAELLRQRRATLQAGYDDIAAQLAELGDMPRVVVLEVEYTQRMRASEIAWLTEVINDTEGGELAWLEAEPPSRPDH